MSDRAIEEPGIRRTDAGRLGRATEAWATLLGKDMSSAQFICYQSHTISEPSYVIILGHLHYAHCVAKPGPDESTGFLDIIPHHLCISDIKGKDVDYCTYVITAWVGRRQLKKPVLFDNTEPDTGDLVNERSGFIQFLEVRLHGEHKLVSCRE